MNPFFTVARSKTSFNHKNQLRRTIIKDITMQDLTVFGEEEQARLFEEMLDQHVPNRSTAVYSINMSYPGMTKPCYLGFRNKKVNTGIAIVKRLETLLQSHEFVKADEKLSFEILVVENALKPSRPLDSQGIINRANGQKGRRIPYVSNLNDSLCLPRAVGIAFAHGGIMTMRRDHGANKDADIPAAFKKLYNQRKNRFKWLTDEKDPRRDDNQKSEALDILTSCGIAADKESYDITDLKTIYENFKPFSEFDDIGYPPFSFHVFSFDGIWKCTLEDPDNKHKQYPLLFLHFDRHMDFAKDLLHKKKLYCNLCNLVYKEDRRHYCKERCFLCNNKAGRCQAVEGEGRRCEECNFYFPNAECFEAHQRPALTSCNKEATLCTQRHRCDGECGKAYHVNTAHPHDCRVEFCKRCSSWVSMDVVHVCGWSDISKTERRNIAERCKKFKTAVFDFETMQNKIDEQDNIEYFAGGHVAIWAGAATVCNECEKDEIDPSGKNVCKNCGGERLFERTYDPRDPVKGKKDYVISEFINYFFCDKRFDGFLLAGHNASGFDSIIILQKLLEMGVAPKILPSGTRVLQMIVSPDCFNEDRASEIAQKLGKPKIENPIKATIQIKCSWLFSLASLGDLAKTFELEEDKTHFPYALISDKYWYLDQDHLPDRKWYEADMRKPRAYEEFNEWYDENQGKPFNLVRELRAYGLNDILMLLKIYLRLKALFVGHCRLDAFQECSTLASTALKTFRLNHLKKCKRVAHTDERGVPLVDNQSMLGFRYLFWYETKRNEERKKLGLPPIHMKTAMDEDGEKVLKLKHGKTYKIDGWWEEEEGKGFGIEVEGCFTHGCDVCSESLTKQCDIEDAESRLHDTRRKMELLAEEGYKILQIWEHTINEEMERDPEMKAFFEENTCIERLFPRTGYYGGRTYSSRLLTLCKNQRELSFYDFASLYPFIMARFSFPINSKQVIKKYAMPGRKIATPPKGTKLDFGGLILCSVLMDPTNKLAVLPYRTNKQLYFGLCSRCCLDETEICQHSAKEREFTGVFTSVELNAAIELGAEITDIIEIWKWSDWSEPGELFGDYVKTFYKLKVANSGWGDKNTPEARREYLEGLKERDGIELKEEDIKENKALRFLSKILLNALFGKLGEKSQRSTIEYVTDRDRIVEIVTDPKLKVTDHRFIPSTYEDQVVDDEAVLMLTYHVRQEFNHSSRHSCLPISIFITSYARLQLFKVIQAVQESHIYSDTDSLVLEKSPETDEALKPFVHGYLGGLESEIKANRKLVEFIAPSAKCYGFRTISRTDPNDVQDVLKVRGVHLHQEALSSLSLDKFREYVENYVSRVANEKLIDMESNSLEERERKKPVSTRGLHVHHFKQRQFMRRNHRIITMPHMKKLTIHPHKGVLDPITTRVYPYGYKPKPDAPATKLARVTGEPDYDPLLLEFM